MSKGGDSSASATAAVPSEEGSGHRSSQQPARSAMLWNRRSNTGARDGGSLPEWKLNCLCSEQGCFFPNVKGGVHIAGGWF
ncbi:hypothetical protein KSP40_PGU017371 [Platanthera guangdongensis]|uniref:Uncharacterized protein n=1 Tax=Platanthera guangdongensis TaxID=2320717 RepID=A0ABR2N2C3_9ASPA